MTTPATIIQAGINAAKTSWGDGLVALGNWNDVVGQDEDGNKTVDNIPERVGDLLERAGVELEWSDEWVMCDDCYRVFRISPDCYQWQMSGVVNDCVAVCLECLDPVDHLDSIENNDGRCNTINSIDPADHEYVRVGSFEQGFHPGQNDDPGKIGIALREAGIKRYLFNLDCNGQFDINFSVYVHDEEDIAAAEAAVESMSRG